MAGIARLDKAPVDAEAEQILWQMAAALAHRGPDDEQVLCDDGIGLAFRRLAVVDPAGGRQPLRSPDGTVVLVVNGEIYNHRELARTLPPGHRPRTGSDCEVLLELYRRRGLDFLEDVRGMFAIALWDRAQRRLVLARDRFGIKPLFFSRNQNRLIFASEMKALFADPSCPRALDWDQALTEPAMDVTPALSESPPTTWFQGIEQVPAGSLLDIDLSQGRIRQHVYWSLPANPSEQGPTDRSFVESYGSLLASSVTECCRADAAIGLFLSGGIDSAAVAALAPRNADVSAFTVRTMSTDQNGDFAAARAVAGEIGMPLHELDLRNDELPDAEDWKRLLWHQESPLCGLEQWYKSRLHRYAKASIPELKVMLLGQGSDEFNGGYSPKFASDWGGFASVLGSLWRRSAAGSRRGLGMWFRAPGHALLTDAALHHVSQVSTRDPYLFYTRAKYRDLQQYNCWHEDRTSSQYGIEARVPFLDHRLVELTASIPRPSRARLLWNKRILRDSMAAHLPHDVVERPKEPFIYGGEGRHTYGLYLDMLTRDGGALVEEAFAAPGAAEFVNAAGVRDVLAAIGDGRRPAHTAESLLRLVNLGLLEQLATERQPTTARPGITATA